MFACFPQLTIFRSNKPSIMATSLLVNVKVHAPLPHDLENTGANSSFDDWLWIHCLTLPVKKLNALQLSSRLYKWICIAMGVTTGAKGHLTSSLDLSEVVDYNAAHLQPEHPNLYYHIGEEERPWVFPVDPCILHKYITSGVPTAWRTAFHSNVVGWNKRRCVLTQVPEADCDTIHIISHSKANEVGCYYFQSVAYQNDCCSTS